MAESKLLKLKTDLKSLKFEPNNEPYIQFPIGYTKSFEKNDPIPQSIADFYLSNKTNPDFPLRGGTIDFDLRTQTFTKASQIDRERIKKFYNDKPRGPIFLQKQIGLQLSNPKIETAGLLPGATFGLENTRFYNNGVNTLVQVGVQGTGVHIVRHGASPLSGLQKAYYDTVNAQNINNSYEANRLVTLKSVKLSKSLNQASPVVAKLGISLSDQTLFRYLGGPDSIYGVGVTTIKRYTDTEQGTVRIRDEMASSGEAARKYSHIFFNKYKDIDDISDQLGTIKDGIQSFPISQRNKEYGIGDPGSNNSTVGVDRLNANTLLYYNADDPPWQQASQDIHYNKDIIKFVFEAIDNDNTANATAVFFRAFLSSITDNHQAIINAFKYAGRGEEFYSYQGAARSIGFSFKIAPQSAEEQRPLYKKLNYLISQVYPDYSSGNIMRAPLMRITIGDYFYRIAGLLESVNISIDDNSPWEISSDDVLKQLPHVINVQCSFKPIQDFLPRREKFSYSLSPYKKGIIDDTKVPYIGDQSDKSDYITADITDRISPVLFQSLINSGPSDEEIAQQFYDEQNQTTTTPNVKLYDAQKLQFNKKNNIFETQMEKNIRKGSLYNYGEYLSGKNKNDQLNQSYLLTKQGTYKKA